jgi:prevent-host-death family protein
MVKKTVSTSELKAHCAQVIEDVSRGKGPVTVTRRGRPIARIVALKEERPRLFGALKGMLTIHGDIISPVDVEWEAERET